VALAETVVSSTQRLYELADLSCLDPETVEALKQAEENIYADPDNPKVNWNADDVNTWAETAGLITVHTESRRDTSRRLIPTQLVERWFSPGTDKAPPTYRDRLAQTLSDDQIESVQRCYTRTFTPNPVSWQTTTLLYVGRKP